MATAPDQKAPSAQPPEPRPRKLGSLRMIWRYASRYPFQVIVAAVAPGIAAIATLAIPWQFKAMIDRGFVAGGGDVAQHLRLFYVIVHALALATALRFSFARWRQEERRVGKAIGSKCNYRWAPRRK